MKKIFDRTSPEGAARYFQVGVRNGKPTATGHTWLITLTAPTI